ncbi:MAG TPA: dihydrolipoyl dehydrogenase [Tissierellia bacterium]|nr:dihydrolipoyl dehydrogenase [Tissierellia bacterium]
MAYILVMPKFGLTMSEGSIAKWHKKEGDAVKKGDELFDVETDKLTNTVSAEEDGILRKIIVDKGKSAKVAEPVGIIAQADEDITDVLSNLGIENSNFEEKSTVSKEENKSNIKDVIVIGGGPGGYVAAIRAAQLGAQVTLVEKEYLGGTCLNVGCIPTKVLLHTAELYEEMLNSNIFGIKIDGNVSVDWSSLQKRKEEITSQLVNGVTGLLRLNNIEVVKGQASFKDKNTIDVKVEDGSIITLKAKNFIIATGSKPFTPPIEGIDFKGVVDSTEALAFKEIPKELVIIGGGVIGIEFATLFNSFGTKVTVLEMLPYILPPIDREISEIVKMKLSMEGINIHTSAQVTSIENNNGKLEVVAKVGNDELRVAGDKVLVSVGRRALTEGLNLDLVGIKTNKKGIEVNKRLETNIKGIYAIGDVTGINMLAHVASEQGIVAAENIMGINKEMNYKAIPACIYTKPEIASVGITEEEAKKSGIEYKVGKFMLSNNGKALIANEIEGTMVKIIADTKYGEILGMHIYGPRATDLIIEGALALRLEATVDEIVTTIHPHPTVSESIKEAALSVNNIAIHSAPVK